MSAESHPVSTEIKRRKMKPADAGRHGQAVRKKIHREQGMVYQIGVL